jgi:hypothetical protein
LAHGSAFLGRPSAPPCAPLRAPMRASHPLARLSMRLPPPAAAAPAVRQQGPHAARRAGPHGCVHAWHARPSASIPRAAAGSGRRAASARLAVRLQVQSPPCRRGAAPLTAPCRAARLPFCARTAHSSSALLAHHRPAASCPSPRAADTMYKQRLQTAGKVDRLSQVRRAGGRGACGEGGAAPPCPQGNAAAAALRLTLAPPCHPLPPPDRRRASRR